MPYAARGYYAGGYRDKFKRAAKKLNSFARSTQVVSKVLRQINNPTVQKIANAAASMGYGYRGCGKRKRKSSRRRRRY